MKIYKNTEARIYNRKKPIRITQSHVQKKVAADMGMLFLSDFEFWRSFDLMMLRGCTELYVLKLKGWEDSAGLCAEINEA